ncbi:hypothetical protein HYT23_03640 [Candidatus Pacearchaeota archaeon]|nr:hypothetical protein [Candidatus Pacearchaeota archaeon]
MGGRNFSRKSQIGVEYMIVVGFVTFAILSVLTLAYFYSDQIKESIRLNQIESFATQLVRSAEGVFFSGEPSRTTVRLYLPDGVESIQIVSDAVIITTNTGKGNKNIRVFESKVLMQPGSITPSEGIKKLTLTALAGEVSIIQG